MKGKRKQKDNRRNETELISNSLSFFSDFVLGRKKPSRMKDTIPNKKECFFWDENRIILLQFHHHTIWSAFFFFRCKFVSLDMFSVCILHISLGLLYFRVQYCEIGRYDKKLSHSFIHTYFLFDFKMISFILLVVL